MSGEQQTTALVQGELWSARAPDWAEAQEPQHRGKYGDAVRRLDLGPGRLVLDLGCGAGTFCLLAADAGAAVSGIDAAPGLIEIARERVPEGRFDVGHIQSVPYEDGAFDRVTAFKTSRPCGRVLRAEVPGSGYVPARDDSRSAPRGS